MADDVKDGEQPAADNTEAESGAQAQGDGDHGHEKPAADAKSE